MNPYQQNINIMKGFFKKPLTLVFSICTFVTIFVTSVTNFLLSTSDLTSQLTRQIVNQFNEAFKHFAAQNGINYYSSPFYVTSTKTPTMSIDLLGVLLGITLILFYVQSQSEINGRTLRASRIMFRIYAIFKFVAGIIICAVGVPSLLFSVSFTSSFMPHTTWFFIAVIPLIVILLLYGISIHVFAKTIKKNLTSIFLTDRGAKFFGVMSIITALISLGTTIISLLYFNNIGIRISAVDFGMIITKSVFDMIFNVLFAVLAFSFSSYIKGYSKEYVVEAYEYEQTTAPNFTSEPAQAAQQQAPVFCSRCGRQLNPDDYFCNGCGTPVQRP